MLAVFNDFPACTVVRDGVALQTRSGGSGPPLLLLHGHPQSMAMWHRVLPGLAEGLARLR
jgi:haloacetate dehalogenase